MIKVIGKKVELRKVNQEDINELYYWKFEDDKQEAKKWNGPYIPEVKRTKEEYQEIWKSANEILPGIPNTLVISVKGNLIGTVGSYWVDKNTNWLETGIVDMDLKHISFGLTFYLTLLIYIV